MNQITSIDTVSNALAALDTNIAESLVTIEAITIAAETMMRGHGPDTEAAYKMATHIVCLSDRARREIVAASDEMDKVSDATYRPAGIPTAAQVRAEDFAFALVTYERAKAAMNGFWDATIKPLHEQLEAAEGEAKDALSAQMEQAEKDFETFVDQHGTAVIALFNAPSPDLVAHATKLSVWVETDYQDMTDAADMMKVIAADVARLSRQGEA